MNLLENDYESSNSRSTFTCRQCGKTEYPWHGEFQTIKMGDIFTHITSFPSVSSENNEGERLCAQCVNSSQTSSKSTSKNTGSTMQNLNHSNHPSVGNTTTSNKYNNNGRGTSPSPPTLLHSTNTTSTMYRDNNNSLHQQPMSTIDQQHHHQQLHLSHTQKNPNHHSLTVLTTVGTSPTDMKYPISTISTAVPVSANSLPDIRNSSFPVVKNEPTYEILSGSGSTIKSDNPQLSTGIAPDCKECHLCKKTFKNNNIALQHFQRVHEKVGKHCCEICGVVFSYRGSLDTHLASHNSPAVTYDCPTCGQKFKEKPNLAKHMKVHSDNPKKIKCEFCPSSFSKRVNLRYHMKRKHPDEVMNNNNTSNTQSMNTIGSKPGASNLTPTTAIAGTAGKSAVANNKEKPQGNFKCEHCGRTFLFKNNLKAHLRTHTRDKKYTCEICEKSFIYKESLKNHMLLHSNELPYLCDICGKKFRDRSNRRKHVKNVHKYMFMNGDATNLTPGSTNPPVLNGDATAKNSLPSVGSTPSSSSATVPVPTKKKKNSKKSSLEADMSSEKSRGITKSTPGPKNKKSPKNTNNANNPRNTNNKKSVIVSAASTLPDSNLDRKIIMSPSPKTSGSLEYVHSHSLPVTVHVPGAGSNLSPGQFSHGHNHGRNVIVKASSTISSSNQSSNLSPDLDLYQQQQQQHQRVSMQQNVIVYPKPKIIADQQYPTNSVISQNLQQQYYNHNQDGGGYESGNYLSLPLTSLVSPSSSIPTHPPPSRPSPNSAFEYVLSTNTSSDRSNEITRYGPGHGINSSSEISVNSSAQYSSGYSTEPISYQHSEHSQQQHHHPHYWTTNLDANPPSSSPYPVSNAAAPTPDTTGSGVTYEGPITAASNVLNAPSYATLQGHEGVDPSGNGNSFFYKDLSQFDFSYL